MKNNVLLTQSYSAHLLMEEKLLTKKSEWLSFLQHIIEKHLKKIKITKLRFYVIVGVNVYLASFSLTTYMWGVLYALAVLIVCLCTTAALLWVLQKFEDHFPFKE